MIRETDMALRACAVTFVLCAVALPGVGLGARPSCSSRAGGGEPDLRPRADRHRLGADRSAVRVGPLLPPPPSAVDYKADAAGGSNLGTNNPDLQQGASSGPRRSGRRPEHPAPVDLVTASGSGLDPDISPEAAAYQAPAWSRPLEDCRSSEVRGPDRERDESIGRDPRRPAAGQRAAAEPGTRRERRSVTLRPIATSMSRAEGPSCHAVRTELRSPDARAVPQPDPPPDAGPAQGLSRLGGRRRQDLCDAPRGAPAQGAGRRRRHRPGRDPRPRRDRSEQIGDLEIIPPRTIEYRGVTLREMDLDAILARRPTVCLVDELAHTNAPGSRHPKRYQDVEDLLHAGSTSSPR